MKSDLDAGNIVVKGIDTNAIQNNLDYVDSISAIGSVMSSVTNLTE